MASGSRFPLAAMTLLSLALLSSCTDGDPAGPDPGGEQASYEYGFEGGGDWTWRDPGHIWEDSTSGTAFFSVDDDSRMARDEFSATTGAGTSLRIRMEYTSHSDPNSRQMVIVGFVEQVTAALSQVENGLFLYAANWWGQPVVIPYGVVDGQTVNLTGEYPPPSWQRGYGEYDYRIDILSDSEYRTRCWKDGEPVWDSLNDGDLAGVPTRAVAIFNAGTSAYPLEGMHGGGVDLVCYSTSDLR